jgi:predicted dehydrogenase
MVGHLLQYHPVFVRLKELAANGELGRINYIYSNRLNLGKIRREENILWSFAPHDISMILSIAGEEPDRVSATGGNYLHQKIAEQISHDSKENGYSDYRHFDTVRGMFTEGGPAFEGAGQRITFRDIIGLHKTSFLNNR